MLAVHWTPVNNTKHILKKGISKSKNGVYCFPLTGHRDLDKWWVNFFNQCRVRPKKAYSGVVFRISDEDLPAYFGHWIGATNSDDFVKPINTLSELGKKFRDVITWRIGEAVSGVIGDPERDYLKIGQEAVKNRTADFNTYYNDLDFMGYTFDDYQVVLSNSIPAKRIMKIVPQGNEFGKVLRSQQLGRHEED